MQNREYLNSYCRESTIFLEYREDGIRKIETIDDFKWYLVIRKSDFERLKPIIEQLIESGVMTGYEEIGEYVKIFSETLNTTYRLDGRQALIKYLKDNNIEPLEADIFSDKKYCLDNNIQVGSNYKILYFDIETDDTNPSIVVGAERILSIAAVDREGQIFYISEKNEKTLLEKALMVFKNYDVITGWNSSTFDLPYIKARMELHGFRYFAWRSIAHIDLMNRFKHIFRFDSHVHKYSLESISNHFLGHGKVKHTGQKVIDLYHKNPEKLKEYNIQDVVLLKELDDKLGVIDMMILQAKWCNTFLSQFYISELLDNYMLKIAHSNGIYCPSRNFEINSDTYPGGYVLDPIRGIHDNIYIFDFKSLYPTLIMTSNIGFDTVDAGGEITNPGTGVKFTSKKKSVVKLTIEGLIGRRKEYKKKKIQLIQEGKNEGPEWERVVSDEIIVKELANSVYGIMGKKDGRWYSTEVASSITMFGQWAIKYSKKFFESQGFEVVYGDTDSIFVKDTEDEKMKGNIKGFLDKFHETLRNDLKKDYNILENFLELEYEKKFKRMILVDKKNYTGRLCELEGKDVDVIYTRGLDYIKTSSITIAAKSQEDLIRKILFDSYNVDQCENHVNKLLEDVEQYKLNLEDITIQTRLGKRVEEYDSDLPHVRIAREQIAKTGILETNEIEYVVVDSKNKNVVIPDDYQGQYDRSYYWNNRIFPLLERILSICYPNNNWSKYLNKKFQNINQMSLF